MDKKLIEYLQKHKRIAARWSCTLNSWVWPHDLEGKPENFDNLPDYSHDGKPDKYHNTKFQNVSRACDIIAGEKLCFEYHHLYKLGKSRLEFEKWWIYTRYIQKFLIFLFPKHRDFIINLYYSWKRLLKIKTVKN